MGGQKEEKRTEGETKGRGEREERREKRGRECGMREVKAIAGEIGAGVRGNRGAGDAEGRWEGGTRNGTKSAAGAVKSLAANNRRLERERRYPIFNYVSAVCTRGGRDGLSLLLTFQLRSPRPAVPRYISRAGIEHVRHS